MRFGCHLLASFAFTAALSGCGPLGQNQPPINDTPAVDALEDPNHPGLEACSSGHASADVEQSLEIARSFRESCHELVVCGGIASNFGSALVTILLTTALSENPNFGMYYMGSGVYAVGTTMTVELRLHQDTSFGAKGDVIPYDLTNIGSFFQKVTLKATGSIDTSGEAKYDLGIEWEGEGPAFELLGLPKDGSGITLSADLVAEALGKLEMVARANVEDEKDGSTFVYTMASPPTPIADVIEGGSMGWALETLSGENAGSGQLITLDTWDMRYSSHAVLDGTIGFSVTGGAFDYGVVFEYPMRASPDVSLSCAE